MIVNLLKSKFKFLKKNCLLNDADWMTDKLLPLKFSSLSLGSSAKVALKIVEMPQELHWNRSNDMLNRKLVSGGKSYILLPDRIRVSRERWSENIVELNSVILLPLTSIRVSCKLVVISSWFKEVQFWLVRSKVLDDKPTELMEI